MKRRIAKQDELIASHAKLMRSEKGRVGCFKGRAKKAENHAAYLSDIVKRMVQDGANTGFIFHEERPFAAG
jgi:hypothetical protein